MRTVRRATILLFISTMIPFINGCSAYQVGPNASGLKVPVLVGPVHKIGGGQVRLGAKKMTINGEACHMSTGSGANPQPRVEWSDSLAIGLREAGAGVSGGAVTVNEITAGSIYHISLAAMEKTCVLVTSDVWIPDTIPAKEAQQ